MNVYICCNCCHLFIGHSLNKKTYHPQPKPRQSAGDRLQSCHSVHKGYGATRKENHGKDLFRLLFPNERDPFSKHSSCYDSYSYTESAMMIQDVAGIKLIYTSTNSKSAEYTEKQKYKLTGEVLQPPVLLSQYIVMLKLHMR